MGSQDIVRGATKEPKRHIDKGKRTPPVSARIKKVAELLSTTPGSPNYQQLAKLAGYRDAHALRQALSEPQNINYMRSYRQQMLDDICMHNPERLRQIADTSPNHNARVNAVRGLELMNGAEDEAGIGNRHAPQTPGVTIQIVQAPAVGPTIDVTPIGPPPPIWPPQE